jgi:hypothetical protein
MIALIPQNWLEQAKIMQIAKFLLSLMMSEGDYAIAGSSDGIPLFIFVFILLLFLLVSSYT